MKRQGDITMKHARSAARLAAALALASVAAASIAPAAAASGSVTPPLQQEEGIRTTRSKRWWLDQWCHSMQERAFVEWMHQATGSTAWMHVMSVSQVNALYGWWLAAIWTGGDEPPG
jgi:hypothetical protein